MIKILRHRKENLKKCSLTGLENHPSLEFYTYPSHVPSDLNGCLVLALEGEPLTQADAATPLLLIDGTWRYAEVMYRHVNERFSLIPRSIPSHFRTAYPRRQDDCEDPERGLASIEALYISMQILGMDTAHLLDRYHWKQKFLETNKW